jgi:pilus assembly protein CpaE
MRSFLREEDEMKDTIDPTPVMAIVNDLATQQQIRTAIQSDDEFLLVEELESADKASKRIRSAMPSVILVDHQIQGQPSLDLVDELALQFPDIPMVAMLGAKDTLQAQQFMLAGVRGFMIKPFTQVNLLSTLRRMRDLEARRRVAQTTSDGKSSERTEPLQVITVFSPRGGVGCSTIAINLAVALHEQLEAEVLLLEGKLLFGHLGLMINMRPRNTIADLIPHAGALDASLVEEVVSRHASGIHVLLSPMDLNVAQGIRPEALYGVVKGVSQAFDFIVIDSGSFLNENTVTLMDIADLILLVTTPDLAALHDTSRFIQASSTLAFPAEKLLTVLNRGGMVGGLKGKHIESSLHHELFAQIPDGGSSVIRSLNRGVPLLLGSPRNPVSREIRLLATKLIRIGGADMLRVEARKRPGRRLLAARLKPMRDARPAHVSQHQAASKILGQ